MRVISLVIAILIFSFSLSANEGKIRRVVLDFYDELIDENRCYLNINLLIDVLSARNLIDFDEASVVVAESTSNNLILQNTNAYFHVFLLLGELVVDPLLILFEMDESGVMAREEYLLRMFPNLKGARFSVVPARSYVNWDEQEILGLFHLYSREYNIPFGRMRVDIEAVNDPSVFKAIRFPLTQALRVLGLR